MKSRSKAGIFVILLGLLTVTIPQFLFPVCGGSIELANGKALYMKCHFSAMAEIIPGVLIVFDGILIMVFKKHETRIALSIMLFFLGLSVMLIPTLLLGMCDTSAMACRVGTEPALIVTSVIIMLFGAGNILSLLNSERSKQHHRERSLIE